MANTTKRKTGGRKKGTPNKPNKQKLLMRSLLNHLVDSGLTKFKKELNSLNGKEYIEIYIKLLKLKPSEIEYLLGLNEAIEFFEENINKKNNL